MKKKLPMYGVGPLYVGVILITTIVFVVLSLYMWYVAVIKNNVDKYISKVKLLTTGIYSYTRNPIYSAFTILSLGIILIANNYYLLFLPFIYWLFLTILMKLTEEKWLKDAFGHEYEVYKKRVNRCIPIKK